MKKQYDIAAYIWPSYTGDEPRSRIFWPEGYGEWQSVKAATAKYPGHQWPRKPLWGYVNEADPYVMEMQINAAADHGANHITHTFNAQTPLNHRSPGVPALPWLMTALPVNLSVMASTCILTSAA